MKKILVVEGNLQEEKFMIKSEDATFVKYKFLSGFQDFLTLHQINIQGKQ